MTSDDETVIVVRHSARMRAVQGVPFLHVSDRDLLFAADRFTATIWPRLECGLSVAAFHRAADAADRDGGGALAELLEAGAVETISTAEGVVPVTARLCLDLANAPVCLNFCGPRATAIAKAMLGHLETTPRACREQLVVVETPDRIGVAACGGAIEWAPWDQAGPLLKVVLTDLTLETLDRVALHVATMSADGAALLIAGAPGAGKSTLSVALGVSGFRLEGDDIAVLEADGRIRALPFPATLKDGAWTLLARNRPELGQRAAFVRPDGQRVRYLALDCPGIPPARKVRCVLSLHRDDVSAPRLDALGAEQAIATLLDGAWSRDKRLKPPDFEALAACIDGAAFFRLSYSDLATAIPLVARAWCMAEE